MFFRRKKTVVENKPICIHEWKTIDYTIEDHYAGQDVDVVHYYIIGCEKCNSSRKVEQYEYSQMKSKGLIKL